MGHDLAINTAQLQSHATEVDACATTIESAQNIAAGTQNQVSQNAFGLMFLPYAAVAHFGIKNLSAMMKDISEAEHRLAVCLRQTAAVMTDTDDRIKDDTKTIQDDMEDPSCGTGPGGGGTGPGGGGAWVSSTEVISPAASLAAASAAELPAVAAVRRFRPLPAAMHRSETTRTRTRRRKTISPPFWVATTRSP